MAQTVNAISARNLKLEYSLNGTTWNDISGMANSVKPDDGDREQGEDYTFDGDVAVITYGKRKPTKLKIKVLYTEGASDAAEVARNSYENSSDLYFRWSPKGQSTGTFVYTSAAGRVVTSPYPGGEAKSGDPVALEFTFVCPQLTKSLNP
jgi:hypothetical protein